MPRLQHQIEAVEADGDGQAAVPAGVGHIDPDDCDVDPIREFLQQGTVHSQSSASQLYGE